MSVELFKFVTPYLTAAGGIAAFIFAVFKYLHSQNIQLRHKRFEQYRQIFEWVAGRTSDGKPLVDTQQAMAIYLLSEYPEYRNMTIPILEYYLNQTQGNSDQSLFRAALLYTCKELSNDA